MSDQLDLSLSGRFIGLLIVGDVHGHANRFSRLTALADKQDLFLISIGDLIDRGPDSAECLRLMRKVMKNKRGLFLRGNHEDKLYRALNGGSPSPGSSLETTLEELHGAEDGTVLRKWFIAQYEQAPFVVRFEKLLVTHGGFAPEMLSGGGKFSQATRSRALFGNVADQRRDDGGPIRLYDWIDKIPQGTTVVIGHDPISADCLLERRANGHGRLIHLDSGAGKDGPLSALIVTKHGKISKAIQLSPDRNAITETSFERVPG